MKIYTWISIAVAALGLSLLAGCGGFSLAADITPPPDYVTATPVPTLDLAAVLPTGPLDLARGEGIYIENCASCHGDTGMGDGAQAASLQISVPPLVSDTAIRPVKPLDWYAVVSEGRMDRMMPPFRSLAPQQIWESLAYIDSLASTPEQLAEARLVYDEMCTSCHGTAGKGDGPALSDQDEKALDWSDPASLVNLSRQDLADAIANGQGDSMPAFSGRLGDDQRWSLAAYIRRFGFNTASAGPQPGSTPAPSESASESAPTGGETPAAIETAAIKAQVTMASGEALPPGLIAVLTCYEAMQPSFEIQKEIAPDGSAVWDGLELSENRVYLVTVEYEGLIFRSDVIHGADQKPGETADTMVNIYQTTSDASGLVVDRMHVFFDFPIADRIQVVEMFMLSNNGQSMVVPAAEGKTIVDYKLPAGYENLQFESGELGQRYLPVEGGFGDTAGIAPGAGTQQVLFAYELPYDRSAVIPVSMPLWVDSAIFMAPADGVSLEAPGLQDEGSRDIQDGTMHLYSAGGLSAGSTLDVRVSGRPGQAGVISTGAPLGLFIGGGALVLVLVGTALWLMRRREPEEDLENEGMEGGDESVESLLDAILALDDLYKGGKLPKPAYEERRAELKERLRAARKG